MNRRVRGTWTQKTGHRTTGSLVEALEIDFPRHWELETSDLMPSQNDNINGDSMTKKTKIKISTF